MTIVGYHVTPEGELNSYGIYVDGRKIAEMSRQARNIQRLDNLKKLFWFSSYNEQLGFEIYLDITQYLKPNHLDQTPEISIGIGKDSREAEDPIRLIHIPFLKQNDIVLPNDERRRRVQRNTSDVQFITLGYTHYHYYRHFFERYGTRPWNRIEKMLDWGCGCGRVSQFFIRSLKADLVISAHFKGQKMDISPPQIMFY